MDEWRTEGLTLRVWRKSSTAAQLRRRRKRRLGVLARIDTRTTWRSDVAAGNESEEEEEEEASHLPSW